MSRRHARSLPTSPYANRFTEFFFRELQKGFASPYCVVSFGIVMSLAAYKVVELWVLPERTARSQLMPRTRVPMKASHEVLWGAHVGGGAPADRNGDGAGLLPTARPSAALFDPAVAVAEAEPLLSRPHLLYSEPVPSSSPSAAAAAGAGTPTKEEAVILETCEYDDRVKGDVFLRSLHYIDPLSPPEDRRDRESIKSTGSYLANMPGGGEHIHGMVTCRSVGSDQECVPYAGDLTRELARKFLLTLGPAHILQDKSEHWLQLRFSQMKLPEVRVLQLGLRAGEVPRFLSSAYPHFTVDVVEEDASLIRLVKRFFGFTENEKSLRVVNANPVTFVQRRFTQTEATITAKESSLKFRSLFIPWSPRSTPSSSVAPTNNTNPYDLVLIDAVDRHGKLPAAYGQLSFIQQLRSVMSPQGCVAIAIPNTDAAFAYKVIQHWRLVFQGRAALLTHCRREPVSLLMLFQDEGGRGKGHVGVVSGAEEMKDLIRSHITSSGIERIPMFDLTAEVESGGHTTGGAEFFKVIRPGEVCTATDYAPPGHPVAAAAMRSALPVSPLHRWKRWLHRRTGDSSS